MVTLRELLAGLPAELSPNQDWRTSTHPAFDTEVTGLSTNSWDCKAGNLFIGMPGTRVDGGDFWDSALAAGAIAALVSPQVKLPDANSACVLSMTDMNQVCAELANAFYGYPTRQLNMAGVTGTNGKTTITHLIDFLLTQGQRPTALFGTLYARWPGHQVTATHTTPFAVDLQQQLAEAVAAGCQYGVMEVSSHALDQKRTWGCEFDVAVFSNLTQDHLDYHNSLEEYFAAKALLFSPDYLKGRAVVNIDDPYGHLLSQQLEPSQLWTYSTESSEADLWTGDLHYAPRGVTGVIHSPRGDAEFHSPLVGQFNVANLLAAVGAGLALGLDLAQMVQSLTAFPGVPGRMQPIQVRPEQDISVIVDYAHTPDSLENLLLAARPFVAGKMICVFGCGGDRDRSKRPRMGAIAARLADQAVVTSDNPRTEDPQRILEDILTGIPTDRAPVVEVDRRLAIETAIAQAAPGDTVLIAGKGHEDYQILGTEKVHFDDREEARSALSKRTA